MTRWPSRWLASGMGQSPRLGRPPPSRPPPWPQPPLVTADLDDVPGAELWGWTRRDDGEPEWRRLPAHDVALPPERRGLTIRPGDHPPSA